MEDHIPTDELASEYAAAADYEDQAVATLARFQCRIEEITNAQRSVDAGSSASTVHAVANVGNVNIGLRLPRLEIKPFNGNIREWTAFWEQFDGTLHSNATLSGQVPLPPKLLERRSCCSNRWNCTTSARYENAVQQLRDRYDDKQQIEQHHLRALRDIRCVRLASDVQQLRILYDQVQMNIRGLDAIGVPTSSFSAMLYYILLRAMPQEIVLSFHHQRRVSEVMLRTSLATNDGTASSCQELESLLQFTRIEIEIREGSGTLESTERTYNRKHVPSASVLHSAHMGKLKYEEEQLTSSSTLSRFLENIVKKDRRYEVAVPRKEPHIELIENNYLVARNRLQNLIRRLSATEGLLERYDHAIRQYADWGHAERSQYEMYARLKRRAYISN
ncbi:hypothetical protein HPB50_007843 [Hyalomma asiaticum]|uniref:Uncharacterized protein n=1 Tax=Hyalomma asiaticum TaxID=266040 RepID=A0ACB7T509_HYAAI|nr:hypothetical protein HPB50_007843 [Hyalomma asiaticum]